MCAVTAKAYGDEVQSSKLAAMSLALSGQVHNDVSCINLIIMQQFLFINFINTVESVLGFILLSMYWGDKDGELMKHFAFSACNIYFLSFPFISFILLNII